MRRWVRSDKGNILIMMAGAMAVLAGFGILTIDIGRMLVTRTQLQNGADAGALAGAAMYCSGTLPEDGAVMARAELIAEANKALEVGAEDITILPGDIVIEHSANAHDVIVTTRSNTRQFLTGLFTIFQNSNPDTPDPVGTAGVMAVAAARCGGTCSVSCVKPWAPPDRWDDFTGIPGYMGERQGRKLRPDWRDNDTWDHEKLTSDVNENGLYNPGDLYVDDNGNGRYDEEAYHPLLTGYGPDPYPGNYLSPNGDLGLELTLHFDNGAQVSPVPGQYQSIMLPPSNKGTPVPGADEYRDNIKGCNPVAIEQGDWLRLETGAMVGPTNQGMERLIRQDPDAYWDSSTQSIQDSRFAVSPRIVLIPIYDPRIPVLPGHQGEIQVVKVAAFFMEEMTGPAEVRGRFIKVRHPGEPCPDGQNAGFFTYNLSLIR